ncbi:hypothetical protein KIPB_005923 [Kipferlia bialata]|uniref:Uncharacterized protein n=1 Tax=Kipferlia bialata TaxID=797122 RepID=A0A391P2V4_9EUKA|nr:hypothetical protein KIPB_005923 [Kipferlia bialata]|eukprot:g5923.t1
MARVKRRTPLRRFVRPSVLIPSVDSVVQETPLARVRETEREYQSVYESGPRDTEDVSMSGDEGSDSDVSEGVEVEAGSDPDAEMEAYRIECRECGDYYTLTAAEWVQHPPHLCYQCQVRSHLTHCDFHLGVTCDDVATDIVIHIPSLDLVSRYRLSQ